jgi:Flp pilus assembly protein TadG
MSLLSHSAIAPMLRQFARARDGVAALEFAFIAPVFLMLMMGVIETSLLMLTQNTLENAIFAATRTGKTGYTASGSTQVDTIRAALNSRAISFIDTTQLNLSYKSYNQFDQIGQPEPFVDANSNGVRDNGENYTDVNANGQYDTDMGASDVGGSSEVVVYTVTYPWRINTPMIGRLFTNNGNLTLTARAVVQNEPY